jgi:hypothetical protein
MIYLKYFESKGIDLYQVTTGMDYKKLLKYIFNNEIFKIL